MKQKNNTILVLMIGVTFLVGVLTSFGMPALSGGRTPEVVLPDVSESMGEESIWKSENAALLPVEITPETVQEVIKTLHRPTSYYRELTTTLLGRDQKAAASTVQVWEDGGYSKITILDPDGTMHHRLLDGKKMYIWFERDTTWFETTVTDDTADRAQQIPTYEDILQAEKSQIVQTGYEKKNGKDCILVAVKIPKFDYLERYWVETATGLLIAAESEENGSVFYKMSESETVIPLTQDVSFTLPNGKELHRVSGSKAKQ